MSQRETDNQTQGEGYPRGKATAELKEVDDMQREALLSNRASAQNDREDRVTMEVTFKSVLPDIRAILKRNRHILQKSDKLETIFQKDPMIAYKKGSNLIGLLVHK